MPAWRRRVNVGEQQSASCKPYNELAAFAACFYRRVYVYTFIASSLLSQYDCAHAASLSICSLLLALWALVGWLGSSRRSWRSRSCASDRVDTKELVELAVGERLELRVTKYRVMVTTSMARTSDQGSLYGAATYVCEDVRVLAATARRVVGEEHELDGHGGARAPREELQRAVIPAVNHARCALLKNECQWTFYHDSEKKT